MVFYIQMIEKSCLHILVHMDRFLRFLKVWR